MTLNSPRFIFSKPLERFYKRRDLVYLAGIALFLLYFFILYSDTNAKTVCGDEVWAKETEELIYDKSLVRGHLENGLHYAIQTNKKPENRIALYLVILAGSIHETEKQRGLAHFLEHMMFNGTTHFPGNSLVEYFQSNGMSFGGDANATTGWERTEYHIILPDNTSKDLNEALKVLGDFAQGALLESDEIANEIGVILAEKRDRDSISTRIRQAQTAFSLKNTRFPQREVIGIEEVIKAANVERLRSYYSDWYRPQNMVLLVVGDIKPNLVENAIKARFSSFRSDEFTGVCPDVGELISNGVDSFYYFEPELDHTKIALESVSNLSEQKDSILTRTREVNRMLVRIIMNNRIDRLLEKEDVPVTTAHYSSGIIANRYGYSSVAGVSSEKKWKDGLGILDEVIRQSTQFGFTKEELTLAKADITASLKQAVLTKDSRDSNRIAQNILYTIEKKQVYLSPEDEFGMYGGIVSKLTLADLNSFFKSEWPANRLNVILTGNTLLKKEGKDELLSAYNTLRKRELAPLERKEVVGFPYLRSRDNKVGIEKRVYDEKNQLEQITFTNGLTVNLKKTDFMENSFSIRVDFGEGKLSENIQGIFLPVQDTINSSGTGKLFGSDLQKILAGSSVQLRFGVGRDSFYWRGSALKEDTKLLMQMVQSALLDPGFREVEFSKSIEQLERYYEKLDRNVETLYAFTLPRFLSGNHSQFGLPPWQVLSSITFDDAKKFFKEQVLTLSDLEISVVGDFNRDKIIKYCKDYFGHLTLVAHENSLIDGLHFPYEKEKTVHVPSVLSDKAMIGVAYPIEVEWNIENHRMMTLLSRAFENRLSQVVREKMSSTYTVDVSVIYSKIFHNFGYISAHAVVEPADIESVTQAVLKEGALLGKNGITKIEFERSQRPLVTYFKKIIKSNSYWLNSVLSLSNRHPEQIQWPTTLLSDYQEKITVLKINDISGRIFSHVQPAQLKILPIEKEKIEQI